MRPGASIATEVKVIQSLKEQGINKADLTREEFLDKCWEWRKEYGGRIVKQLRKLGSSADWQRERFTMDEGCSHAVQEVFTKLYKKGWIYKGSRIVNWCPVCKTSISDAEVEHEEQDGFFWHINYPVVGEEGRFVEIATTRPETLFGDTAVAVNPDDERYKDIVGKTLKLPMMANGHSIGGEQSGHIIFSKHATTGDGILTSLKLMEVIIEKKLPLSALTREVKIYPQVLKNVRVYDKKTARENQKVTEAVHKAETELGEDGRILVRESGTEPLIRVMVEAPTDEVCEKYAQQVVDAMKEENLIAE